jgi:threonyl-tRNA synthetase
MKKYLGTPEMWRAAEEQLIKVVQEKGVAYIDGVGEAAFYGPKLDFMGRDALGREFQAATLQIDFGQPEGFNLTCANEKGEPERIVMLHCAVMGSIERFMVLVIESTMGAFPLWLAPEQVRLAPVNDSKEIAGYTQELKQKLEKAGLRAGVDGTSESVGKKIRAAGVAKVPYAVVVGEKEAMSSKVSPRLRQGHGEFNGELGVDEFIKKLRQEADERARKSVL